MRRLRKGSSRFQRAPREGIRFAARRLDGVPLTVCRLGASRVLPWEHGIVPAEKVRALLHLLGDATMWTKSHQEEHAVEARGPDDEVRRPCEESAVQVNKTDELRNRRRHREELYRVVPDQGLRYQRSVTGRCCTIVIEVRCESWTACQLQATYST